MAVESRIHETVAWVKQHPYATAGVVFIGGAILVYLYFSGGSGPAAASSSGTAQSSYLQAQLVSEATQAQYGAQLGALQAQEQTAAVQVQGAVAVDASRNAASVQIAALNDAVLNQRTTGAVSIAGLQAGTVNLQTTASRDVLLAQIAGNVTMNAADTGAAVNIAGIQGLTTRKVAEFGADSSMYASGAAAYSSTFSQAIAGQLSTIQLAAAGINA
jgi:hypothetical protein